MEKSAYKPGVVVEWVPIIFPNTLPKPAYFIVTEVRIKERSGKPSVKIKIKDHRRERDFWFDIDNFPIAEDQEAALAAVVERAMGLRE